MVGRAVNTQLPRHSNREPDPKQSSWDSNWLPNVQCGCLKQQISLLSQNTSPPVDFYPTQHLENSTQTEVCPGNLDSSLIPCRPVMFLMCTLNPRRLRGLVTWLKDKPGHVTGTAAEATGTESSVLWKWDQLVTQPQGYTSQGYRCSPLRLSHAQPPRATSSTGVECTHPSEHFRLHQDVQSPPPSQSHSLPAHLKAPPAARASPRKR